MRTLMLSALVLLAVSPAVRAQVIFEPVKYQHEVRSPCGAVSTFYYGGSNPAVFDEAARRAWQNDGQYGVREGKPGVGLIHRKLIGSPPFTVYSDFAPYRNAAVYGYTPVDARNEAYDRVPRYFTKAGLLASAVPVTEPNYFVKATVAGIPVNLSRVVVVPAHGYAVQEIAPGTIDIRPARVAPETKPAATRPATSPATEAKPLLIIPKSILNEPLGGAKQREI